MGVFETLYKPKMSIDEGKELALKALNAAMQRDIATGNGVDIMTITEKGVEHVLRKVVNTGLFPIH